MKKIFHGISIHVNLSYAPDKRSEKKKQLEMQISRAVARRNIFILKKSRKQLNCDIVIKIIYRASSCFVCPYPGVSCIPPAIPITG